MSDETDVKKDEKETHLEGHTYDGITELDNPLPNWWLWSFIFTVIFSFLYYMHYEISGSGPTMKAELEASLKEIEKNKGKGVALSETEEALTEIMNRPEIATAGAVVYQGKCSVCHGNDLQGMIGPNLTDKHWIHGRGTRMGIVKVIREGVADKGMPGWSQLLSTDELYAVAAFILSKKDSNPPNPKAPQGEPVEN